MTLYSQNSSNRQIGSVFSKSKQIIATVNVRNSQHCSLPFEFNQDVPIHKILSFLEFVQFKLYMYLLLLVPNILKIENYNQCNEKLQDI